MRKFSLSVALPQLLKTASCIALLLGSSMTMTYGQSTLSKHAGPPVANTPAPPAASIPAACANPITVTHSSSQTITFLNSVSCNNGLGHTNNSYWRAFTLVNALNVTAVEIGVEDANAAGAATTQPITVNIYQNTVAPFPDLGFTLTLMGTANYSVADQAGTIISVPITASLPAGAEMVVEVFTPDGQSAGNLFFIGSNASTETGPSYITAPECGISTPTTTAAIGFPDMHIVMNVIGCCPGAPDAPTVAFTPASACSGTPAVALTPNINCGSNTVVWYDDADMPINAPTTTPAVTTTYKIACKDPVGGCESAKTPQTFTVVETPSSALSASKVDVCPNTEVTLSANCTVSSATVQWNPGAPTVTPNAPDLAYLYKATCINNGCAGNESMIEVRTHRILVDLKNVGVGVQPKALIEPFKNNLAPTNTISAPTSPRLWTIVANGCSESESGVFKLTGPVNFSSIDNNPPYAIFANVGMDYFAIDHPNYGSGGSGFPNGTYTLTVDLRGGNGVGGPFPKNRVATGALLATRTLQFILNSNSREGVEETALSEESWLSVGQNPVNTEVVVRLSGRVGQQIELSLTNLQGQTVQQRSVILNAVQQYEVLNVAQAASGLYILKGQKENQAKTLKVVKAL